jgi:alkylation response protein AidB-like acyl-CoA dehydrogenase
MAYAFTDDHKAIRELVRDVTRDRIAPRAAEVDAAATFPRENFDVLASSDIIALAVPEEYGGAGADALAFAIAIEELAYGCAATALCLGAQHLGALPLVRAGSEEQKQRWLPRIATGEVIPAYCVTEPETGSDVAAARTTARRTDDGYVLDGVKRFVTNAGVADYYLVFAKTDPDGGSAGMTAFIVEADRPGVSIPRLEHKMGLRGSPTGDVVLDGVLVPEDARLGAEGSGFALAMWVFDRSRPTIAAQAVGIARGALDYAVAYCLERKAFGQPLLELQGMRWMAAEASVEVQAARELLYSCAALIDDPLARRNDISVASAMAKYKAAEVAMSVTTTAVQMLGGYGYMTDYPVERMMRDAKVTQIYEGTSQIQKEILGRALIAAAAVPVA